MAIRYDSRLQSDLYRTVSNFNAKVNRLKKLDRGLHLPENVSVRELKNKYTNRKDLKREIENLKLFSTRGIEESVTTSGGVTLSKYELEITKRKSRQVKSYLTREIKRRERTKIKTFGITEDVTQAEIGERSYINLKAKRKALDVNFGLLSAKGFEGFVNLLDATISQRNYQLNQFQYNWANEILMPVAYMSGYDMSKLETVVKKISALKPEQFYKLYNDEEFMKKMADYYAELKKGIAGEKKISEIHEVLDQLQSDIDIILKDYV